MVSVNPTEDAGQMEQAARDQVHKVARELSDRLRRDGFAVSRTLSEKRLFLVASSHVGEREGELIISMEAGGCFVWDGSREVNAFLLVGHGFDLSSAATLAAVINALYSDGHVAALSESRKHERARSD